MLGTFNACRAAFEHMRKPGACVLNISAPQAYLPMAMQAHVCAAKAGVDMITRTLAIEWGGVGVRVNSITPGFFPAEQNKKLLFKDDGTPTPRTEAIWGHTPMKRFGESHELQGACIYLAAHKASSFVTGTDLVVDGGYLAQTI